MAVPEVPGRVAARVIAWLLSPALLAQGVWVRQRTPRLDEASGPREGQAGKGRSLRMIALGDSIIAGVGVTTTAEALPARLADSLARRLGCRVRWFSHGFNGARTRDLIAMPATPLWRDADLLVVSNGLNDVTALASLGDFRAAKTALYSRLGNLSPGALIAQIGIPPLGHFPALPQPLRMVLGQRAGEFDRVLESLVSPMERVIYLPFTDIPGSELFAADGYHPGPEAVTIWAESLAESIALAIRGHTFR